MSTNENPVDDGLFLSWQHVSSQRHAVLEQLDGMVWLYLTEPGSMKPIRDCPVFTTVPPAAMIDWQSIKNTEQTPPITRDIASAMALIEHPRPEEFAVYWSEDGDSIAIVRGGEIIGMIVAGAPRGHSRALSKESPLGLPFDDALAAQTFPGFAKK